MSGLFKRYGFAAVVALALGAMVLVVAGKTVFAGVGSLVAGAQGGGRGPGGPGGPVGVAAVPAGLHSFTDGVQAIGTAPARESILITPKVADPIRLIRFDSGDRVRRGQVLVEMSSVEQAASVAEARASNDAAQEELRRFQELYDRGFASQARIDAVRAAADAAQARLSAGDSRAADRTIRAPFAGVVGLRTASPGQYIRPGEQIGTLDDIGQIKLDFDVPETHLARVSAGVVIVARTAAFPDRSFTGAIDHVDTRVNPATRTVRVRALLPNTDEMLRPGMLMTVEVRSNPREALSVPEIAILEEAGGSYVYRVTSGENGQTVERVVITTGQRAGGMAEVLSGLQAGDLVVTEGLQSVSPGRPVRINNADATAPAAGELRPRG
jgi:membrane fusion protein (multidrug efflux system)